MGIIYQAYNTINNTLYIGKTTKTLKLRASQHCSDAKANRSNMLIHKAIRKYGCGAFEWTVLAEVDDSIIDAAEIYYIDLARDQGFRVYNMTDGGEGGTGYKHSEEARRKISISSRIVGLRRMKTYVIRSPDGQIIEIHGLREFCRQHNLSAGHISSVLSGKLKSHKGWTLP